MCFFCQKEYARNPSENSTTTNRCSCMINKLSMTLSKTKTIATRRTIFSTTLSNRYTFSARIDQTNAKIHETKKIDR